MQARTPVPPRTGTAGPAHLVGEGVPGDGIAVAGAGVQAGAGVRGAASPTAPAGTTTTMLAYEFPLKMMKVLLKNNNWNIKKSCLQYAWA